MTLQLENVARSVAGEATIRGVSLTLAHASLNVLLGPTLSGKTSLMRLMAGLDAPESGREQLGEELREELPKLCAASGRLRVSAPTEPTEALLLGGNTATLHEGRVTQFGPTLQVYRRPVDRITAEVFPHPPMNFVAARVSGG